MFQNSYFFIINPNANSGLTYRIWIQKILPVVESLKVKFAWSLTRNTGEASIIAYHAQCKKYSVVICVGGDGTLNEIVNGLCQNTLVNDHNYKLFINGNHLKEDWDLTHRSDLAIIPAGTGCDFARSISVPGNAKKALDIVLSDKIILSDVGKIILQNGFNDKHKEDLKYRYFINTSGFGLSAEAICIVDKYKKKLGTKLSYYYAALKTGIKGKSHHVMLSYDEKQPIESKVHVTFICNAKYCGGGMLIGPEAEINDNKFTVNQINYVGKVKSLLLSSRLYSGKYSDLSDFITLSKASTLAAQHVNDSVGVECDGEYIGNLPVSYSLAEQKIRIKVGV